MSSWRLLGFSTARITTAVLVVVLSSSCFAAGDNSLFIESKLADVFGYYFKEEGTWRQDNAGFAKGSGEPVAYIKQYSWGPGKTMVFDDTYALMEDGGCLQWTHNVYNWDLKESQVRGNIFHVQGLWFTGLIQRSGEDETSATFSATMPDGSEFRMRDSTDISNPGKATISAEIWDGKKFISADESAWTLIPAGENPCAHQ